MHKSHIKPCLEKKVWKSLNCNFVDTLLKTQDISRKCLQLFHGSKWILRKFQVLFFTFFAWFFAGFHLLTIARIQINFQIKTIFFYFGKKITSQQFFLLLLTKVFILKEAHLVRFCDIVIFNYCKWQNLSTNYKKWHSIYENVLPE